MLDQVGLAWTGLDFWAGSWTDSIHRRGGEDAKNNPEEAQTDGNLGVKRCSSVGREEIGNW